jgi:hypothetical protein
MGKGKRELEGLGGNEFVTVRIVYILVVKKREGERGEERE